MINDLKKSGDWKFYLTIKMNFASSKEEDVKHLVDSKSNKII